VNDKEEALELFTTKAKTKKKTDHKAPGGYRYVTVGPEGQGPELALGLV
jgi:hypothetical protein